MICLNWVDNILECIIIIKMKDSIGIINFQIRIVGLILWSWWGSFVSVNDIIFKIFSLLLNFYHNENIKTINIKLMQIFMIDVILTNFNSFSVLIFLYLFKYKHFNYNQKNNQILKWLQKIVYFYHKMYINNYKINYNYMKYM